jgi:hypothetical protein
VVQLSPPAGDVCPAGHAAHTVAPAAAEIVPAEHRTGGLKPPGQYDPEGHAVQVPVDDAAFVLY